jgi:hypothetical protein
MALDEKARFAMILLIGNELIHLVATAQSARVHE